MDAPANVIVVPTMEGLPVCRLFFAALLAASLVGPSATYAQSLTQQARWCGGLDGASTDLIIKGCTAIIQSSDLPAQIRADAFLSRGTSYGNKGQNDLALQDYDQAIRLKPDYADAFFNRGYTYYLKGQNDRAIQEYDQAIRFNPNFALAFKYRGEAKVRKGDAAGGNADFARAKQLNPNIK